jgi:4-amino-4-deoxy-L-arabinose transferase-like glycosyltransferase
LLAGLFLVIATSTTTWVLRDKTPPPWDPADHIRYAYDYYRLLCGLDLKGFAREFFIAPHFYAPLVHLVTATTFLVFGASRLTAILINFLSLGVLVTSVSWIVRDILARSAPRSGDGLASGTPPTSYCLIGALAAMIASCSHFSAWLVHDAFLDFPLMAVVSGCMALLIRAGDFSSRRSSLQFAAAAGLGVLVKQTFPFFFVLPALYVAGRVLYSKNRNAIVNLAVTVLVIATIASIWYGPHLHDVISIYHENQRAAIDENEAPLFSFDSNFFPIHALLSFQLQVPFAVLFLVGLVYSIVRNRRESMVVVLWLVSGLLLFAMVANKDVRYTVPVVPAAAVLSVCWLRGLLSSPQPTPRRVGRLVSLLIVSWSLVSLFNAQWPSPGMGLYINTPRYQWMVLARNYFGFDHRPLTDDWSVPEIVQRVASLGPPQVRSSESRSPATDPSSSNSPKVGASPSVPAQGDGSTQPTLGVVVNLPHLNPSAIALYSRLLTKNRCAEPLVRVRWLVIDGSLSQIGDCDYLLVRTGLSSADWVAPIEREFEKAINDLPSRFEKVATFPIPLKNAEAILYRVAPESRQSNAAHAGTRIDGFRRGAPL